MGGTARGPGLGSAAGCVRRKTGRPFPPPGVGRLCVPARRARDSVLWPGYVRREAGRPLPPPGFGQLCVRASAEGPGLGSVAGCVRRETGRPLPPPGFGRLCVRASAEGPGLGSVAGCVRRETGRPLPPPGFGRPCVQARRVRGLVLWPDAFAGKQGVRFATRLRPAARASAEGPGLGSVAWMRSPGNRASASPPGFGRPRVPARRGRATGGGRAAPRHCLRRYVPCAPRHCLRQHVPCAPRHCPRQHVPCAPQHCLRQHVPCAPRPPQASVRTRSRPWSHQPKRAPPCSFFFSKCSVRC